jgi:hypothetical protein
MYSKFSRKWLPSATDELYINIITCIRQTELCGAPHNSVTVNVIEAIGRRIRAVDEQLRREDAAA